MHFLQPFYMQLKQGLANVSWLCNAGKKWNHHCSTKRQDAFSGLDRVIPSLSNHAPISVGRQWDRFDCHEWHHMTAVCYWDAIMAGMWLPVSCHHISCRKEPISFLKNYPCITWFSRTMTMSRLLKCIHTPKEVNVIGCEYFSSPPETSTFVVIIAPHGGKNTEKEAPLENRNAWWYSAYRKHFMWSNH